MLTKSMTIEARLTYLSIQRPRYLKASRKEKGEFLDEMQAVTGLA